MKCTNCGREFEGTFCPDCGTKAAAQDRCPVCGAQHTEGEQFCPNCGYSFTGTSAQANKERRKRPKKPALLLPLSNVPLVISGWAAFFAFILFLFLASKPAVFSDFLVVCLTLVGSSLIFGIGYFIPNTYMLGLGDFRATYLEKKVKKKGNAVAVPKDFFKNNMIGVIIFEAIIVILSVLFIYRAQTALTIRSYPAIITGITFSILIPVIATISYCLWWKKRKKEIDAAYYGTENGNIGNQCTVTYLLLASEIRRYSVEWVDFWRDVFRREPLTAEEKQKRTKSARQILQFFICEALAIALVFVAILPIRSAMTYVSHNIFYIEKVNAVDIGDSYETVEELLPDPYARDAGTQTWTYYDNNFKKLLEKNENFDPSDIQDWDDFEDAFNDAAELETTQFGYIEVHFERESGNSGTYIVSSVFFDPARQYRDGYEHREAESYEALDISVDEETDAVTVIYSATYEDGSFYKGKAAGTIERGSIASGRTITLSWRDYFGNACEAEYTIPAQS